MSPFLSVADTWAHLAGRMGGTSKYKGRELKLYSPLDCRLHASPPTRTPLTKTSHWTTSPGYLPDPKPPHNDLLERTQAEIQLTCGARGAGPAWRTLTFKSQGGLLATAPVVAGIREAGVLRCKDQDGNQQETLPTPSPHTQIPHLGHQLKVISKTESKCVI